VVELGLDGGGCCCWCCGSLEVVVVLWMELLNGRGEISNKGRGSGGGEERETKESDASPTSRWIELTE
jgi:hypothetical protein